MSLVAICLASAGGYVQIRGRFREDPGELAWVFFLVLGTAYAYLWDVVMDWGLVEIEMPDSRSEKRAGGTWGWRLPVVRWAFTRERVFRGKAFYAWALISNLAGRLAWAVTVTPHGAGAAFLLRLGLGARRQANFGRSWLWTTSRASPWAFVAVLELLRRAQWTFRWRTSTEQRRAVPERGRGADASGRRVVLRDQRRFDARNRRRT